jgi:glyoxylase-like metal-dependent hydrolase (beta-lactamase superfamily II)
MEIVSGVHMIEGITAHCYLVVDTNLTLIDTGLPHKTKKIMQYITEELHRTPSDVKTIILTHGDVDHIGNAEELRRLTGAKLVAHPDDAEIIAGRTKRVMPQGGMSFLFKLLRPLMKTKPFEMDLLVHDGDDIAGLKVIHMPGHTPGSIALYDSKRKVLFAGDTLRFRNGIVNGPSEKMTMDRTKAFQSIEKLASFDFDVMLSGHSEPLRSHAAAKVQEFITTGGKN